MSVCASSLSHAQLLGTLWTVAHSNPLSMGFPRQEYWTGLPFPSPVTMITCYYMCMLSYFSHVPLFATLRIAAHQSPPSMGFFRQDTGVGCHALLQGIFPTQELNPHLFMSAALASGFFTTSAIWEAHMSLYICSNQ